MFHLEYFHCQQISDVGIAMVSFAQSNNNNDDNGIGNACDDDDTI